MKAIDILTESEQGLVDQIECMIKITTDRQKKYYQQMLNDLKIVKCVPLEQVFSPADILVIKNEIKPKKKQCYKNAYELAKLFGERGVKYVEGKSCVLGIIFDHAFNKIDDKYFDITRELSLKEEVVEYPYAVLGEYDDNTALSIMSKNGVYGEVYNTLLIDKIFNK